MIIQQCFLIYHMIGSKAPLKSESSDFKELYKCTLSYVLSSSRGECTRLYRQWTCRRYCLSFIVRVARICAQLHRLSLVDAHPVGRTTMDCTGKQSDTVHHLIVAVCCVTNNCEPSNKVLDHDEDATL